MSCNSCVLKDHFALPRECSNARYISELAHNEQILKETKLKQFLIKEQKRSKLYRTLVAKVNSSCIDDKPLSALPAEKIPTFLPRNASCDTTSRVDCQTYNVIGDHSEVLDNSEKFSAQSPKHDISLSSRTTITNTTTHNIDKYIEESIDNLSNRAKELSLHSFPYLVNSLKLKTFSLYEHKARQLRQAVGRRVYSDAERKRVCDLRRNKEDLILSENIKAKAEKHFRNLKSNKTLESSYHSDKNSTQIISTNKNNLTINMHNNPTNENKLNTDRNQVLHKSVLSYSENTDLLNCNDNKELNQEQSEHDDHNDEMVSLWHRLSSRLNKKIPPLCLCMQYSQDEIDEIPQWLKCANNCTFYHNPEAFLKVLLDYIQSLNLS
ncbi:unnamed protein product [Schistosoma turkestanicum]|nr:unnamed protein product [Schistosoma turkestanicum]